MGKRAATFAVALLLLAAATAASASEQIQLLYAKTGFGLAGSYAYGYAEVQNLGYEKKVTALYRFPGGDWVEAPATYLTTTHDGLEAWAFATGGVLLGTRQASTIELKLRYEVAGATYVDDNRGQDYFVGVGYAPSAPTLLLAGSPLLLSYASGISEADDQGVVQDRGAYGSVLVKNLAYEKRVQIVYSTDGWRTVRTADAAFSAPLSTDPSVEIWTFQFDLGGTPPSLQFAVNYQTNGMSYWDNNFGQNYTITY